MSSEINLQRRAVHLNKISPWKLDLGANFQDDHSVTFKVWAPKCKEIAVKIHHQEQPLLQLKKNEVGYFIGTANNLPPGTLYKYLVDNKDLYPDPVSRFLPEGLNGPSMIVDPKAFEWHDQDWPGIHLKGQVIYELHIGSFTPEGTFDAATQQLEELCRLGTTLIEVMPIAEFPGRWSQGYDGASLYAPSHNYGDHEAFKRFIDKAHQLGMGIILDVVYNHFGPVGNYTGIYSDFYLSKKYYSDWGDVINFDDVGAKEVREFFINNARYWVSEFHVDGFRIDASQDIYDESLPHILAELSQEVRKVALPKQIVIIAENEPQDTKFFHPIEKNGYGLDGAWNDDFHHSAIVALKGRREAYYTDYRGVAQEFISMIKRGYLYQGQAYSWQNKSRGTIVTDEPASSFIFYLQNHDQISNELRGERIHTLVDPGLYRALTAVLLLSPQTPLLFMGQEFASSKPFMFFADHENEELAKQVSLGRRKFLEQFPSHASAYRDIEAQRFLPDTSAEINFQKSKLDFSEREKHRGIYRLHADLIKLRQTDPVVAAQDRFKIDGAVLDQYCFLLRYFGQDGDDRLLLVNLERDLEYYPLAEPLIAPSKKGSWELIWSSDDPKYGGPGVIVPYQDSGWRLPSHSAILLKAISAEERPRMEKKYKESH